MTIHKFLFYIDVQLLELGEKVILMEIIALTMEIYGGKHFFKCGAGVEAAF